MKGVIVMIAKIITRLFKEASYVILTILTIIFTALAAASFEAGLTVLGIIMSGVALWNVINFARIVKLKNK